MDVDKMDDNGCFPDEWMPELHEPEAMRALVYRTVADSLPRVQWDREKALATAVYAMLRAIAEAKRRSAPWAWCEIILTESARAADTGLRPGELIKRTTVGPGAPLVLTHNGKRAALSPVAHELYLSGN